MHQLDLVMWATPKWDALFEEASHSGTGTAPISSDSSLVKTLLPWVRYKAHKLFLARIELIFILVIGTALQFGFSVRAVLMAHWCFRCCWAEDFSALPGSRCTWRREGARRGRLIRTGQRDISQYITLCLGAAAGGVQLRLPGAPPLSGKAREALAGRAASPLSWAAPCASPPVPARASQEAEIGFGHRRCRRCPKHPPCMRRRAALYLLLRWKLTLSLPKTGYVLHKHM